jgi:hypothetical protein
MFNIFKKREKALTPEQQRDISINYVKNLDTKNYNRWSAGMDLIHKGYQKLYGTETRAEQEDKEDEELFKNIEGLEK